MTTPSRDEEDQLMQASIRSRANKSLAVLEKAFIRNGSGRYFVLRTNDLAQPDLPIGFSESTDK